MIIGIYAIVILWIFLLGYAIGRRVGRDEGYRKGIAYAPLKIRRDHYDNGICSIDNE